MQTGFLDRSIEHGGTRYPYQLYVPSNYDASRSWPVVLFLHGAGERGTDGRAADRSRHRRLRSGVIRNAIRRSS